MHRSSNGLPAPIDLDVLLSLLSGLGDDLPAHRVDKVSTLYNLASRIGNNVVELGTYHGTGAIALGYGVVQYGRGHVWTVDSFAQIRGWAGEQYGPADRLTFSRRLLASGLRDVVTQIQQPVRFTASTWPKDRRINLLFWDLGMMDRLDKDVEAWSPLLTVGGTLAIHDTEGGILGADWVVGSLKDRGWISGGTLPGDIRVVIKTRVDA